MKKNFRFYAIVLLLAVAALGYFLGGQDSAVLDTAVDILEVMDVEAAPLSASSGSHSKPAAKPAQSSRDQADELSVEEDGWYYSKEEVALYIHTYGRLPDNFVSKREAEEAGWEGGSVQRYIPGAASGGSRFGNYEGLLPKAKGRTWTECDINTDGKRSRGAERIVFSNDGLIYYTPDHYESFELLYGED